MAGCDRLPRDAWRVLAHFSDVAVPGYKTLALGQAVVLEWETASTRWLLVSCCPHVARRPGRSDRPRGLCNDLIGLQQHSDDHVRQSGLTNAARSCGQRLVLPRPSRSRIPCATGSTWSAGPLLPFAGGSATGNNGPAILEARYRWSCSSGAVASRARWCSDAARCSTPNGGKPMASRACRLAPDQSYVSRTCVPPSDAGVRS